MIISVCLCKYLLLGTAFIAFVGLCMIAYHHDLSIPVLSAGVSSTHVISQFSLIVFDCTPFPLPIDTTCKIIAVRSKSIRSPH